MPRTEPQITATYLEGVDACLRDSDRAPAVTLPDLLGAIGLDVARPIDLQARIPLDRFADLLELGAKRTEDACFGLHVAHALPLGVAGVFGYLVMNAPDTQTKIEMIARYSRLICDSLRLTLESGNSGLRVTLEFVPAVRVPHKQLLEFFLALFIVRVRPISGEAWMPSSVAFPYPEPNSAGEYEHLFGTNLTFDARASRMTLSDITIRKPNANANHRLFEALTPVANAELATCIQGAGVKGRLDAHLVASLAVGGARLAASSQALQLPARRLQAELKKDGTSFETVLGDVRRRLAERYLRDTDLPMSEIAMMLGFSQLATFTRAARGWFKLPPTEMRAVLKAQPRPRQ